MVYKTDIILYLVLSDSCFIHRNMLKTDIILYLVLYAGILRYFLLIWHKLDCSDNYKLLGCKYFLSVHNTGGCIPSFSS